MQTMDILSRHALHLARKSDDFRASVRSLGDYDYNLKQDLGLARARIKTLKADVDNIVTRDPGGTGGTGGTGQDDKGAAPKIFGRCAECQGFVLQGDMKCTSCDKTSCHKCAKVVGDAPDDAPDDAPEHRCDPEDVKSLEAIRRSCVNCPRCSVPVFKSSGCNQMFCTACKTPFCWRTGEVLNLKYFHNPHHQQWLNTREGRESDQRANVAIAQCGVIGYGEVRNIMMNRAAPESSAYLMVEMHTRIRDSEHVQLRLTSDVRTMAWLRARYMAGIIDEKEFRRKITLEKKRVDKRRELAQIYAMFVAISGDVIRLLARGEEADFNQTIEFTNEAIESLNVHYGNKKDSWKLKPIEP